MSLSETQPSLAAQENNMPPWLISSLNLFSSDLLYYYRHFAPESEDSKSIHPHQYSLDSKPEKYIALACKMTEYLQDITRRNSTNPNLDSIVTDPDLIKYLTVNFLLSHPSQSINLFKLFHSLQSKFAETPKDKIWAEMGVIVDYIETKGSRCNGGTGFGPDSPSYKRYSKQIKEALVSLQLYS